MSRDRADGGSSSDPGIDRSPVTPPVDGRQVTLGRFEELEAYRGLAALLMVVFHAYQFSREGLGLTDTSTKERRYMLSSPTSR